MKAVFLDRDGTIVRDIHYCRRAEDFEILPTVPEAIGLLNQHGFKVVITTNQSGIGRGYFTEATLRQLHKYLEEQLAKSGACIDAIYYCPHHPDDDCPCRKPEPGLLLKAAKELDINFSRSFMVGDTETDIMAGKSVGCQSVLVTAEPDVVKNFTEPPDYVADNLLQAAQWIVDRTPKVG